MYLEQRVAKLEQQVAELLAWVEVLKSECSISGPLPDLNDRRVSDLLVSNPGLTTLQIADTIDMAPSAVWKILTTGDYVRLGAGKRGKPFIWYHISAPPKIEESRE